MATTKEETNSGVDNATVLNDLLCDKAAIFLEENYISGDTMIDMDHGIDNIDDEDKIGAIYLHDIMSAFVSEILHDLAKEMDKLTKRCDDAKRIPDAIRNYYK